MRGGRPFLRRCLRTGVCCLVAAWAAGVARPGWAGPSPEAWLARLALPAGSRSSSAAQWVLDGRLLAWRVVELPGEVPAVAGGLARRLGGRLVGPAAQPGSLALAGRADGLSWSALVQPAARGRVRVAWTAQSDRGQPAAVDARFAWMPAEARLRQSVAPVGGTPEQRIYSHGTPPAALREVLRRRLGQSGWRPAGDDGVGETWRRGRWQLRVVVVALGRGSGVMAVAGNDDGF